MATCFNTATWEQPSFKTRALQHSFKTTPSHGFREAGEGAWGGEEGGQQDCLDVGEKEEVAVQLVQLVHGLASAMLLQQECLDVGGEEEVAVQVLQGVTAVAQRKNHQRQ